MAASMVVDLVKANFSILNCIVALVSLCVIHAAAVAFYRLNLHPLANFPGPKLAGASYLYEFWPLVSDWSVVSQVPTCTDLAEKCTQASVGTADHDHHRLRRSPASKYFSRSQIVKLEGMIQEKTQVLCDKLLTDSKSTPIQIAAAYSCFTTDALTSYCFGHSLGNLDQPVDICNLYHILQK
ncbi:drug transporter [Purpureocillium lavendulum]|uniref:Drug transporter n=1 Tax=Purpureocillium lavendulum TaxID=1247861 RepID=A0AB34FE05_9HYPO|nr:drug transporter [Purpureocillium lavendulum]